MTILVNTETLATLTLAEVKARLPGWAPPEPPSPESLEGSGWALLEIDPQPSGDFIPGEVREEDGRYFRGWVLADLTDEQWTDKIAARRWQVETGGTTVEGVQVNTERDSQALLTGAAFAATLDPAYRIKWKAATGFVELTGEQVIGLASQVRAFVQACFNREAELLGFVADGSITAEMLEEGWPA